MILEHMYTVSYRQKTAEYTLFRVGACIAKIKHITVDMGYLDEERRA
jgi:hypothetical protein